MFPHVARRRAFQAVDDDTRIGGAATQRPGEAVRESRFSHAQAGGGRRLFHPTWGRGDIGRSALVKRDTWRVHRVEAGDTWTGLAKRYNTTLASVQKANGDELPAIGSYAAVPAAAPAERKTPVKPKAAGGTGKASSAARSATSIAPKAIAPKSATKTRPGA